MRNHLATLKTGGYGWRMISEVLWKSSFSAMFLAACGLVSADITEQDLGAFHRPAADSDESFSSATTSGALAEIARSASFKSWKTFEDDRVSFRYPDHERITVEVKDGEPVPLGGGRVSDVDTSFSRAYRLAADGETLTAFFLKDTDWFDDGICFCGAIVYDRYLVRDGHLYRFGFLKSGVMKKMEVLGDKERLMMFEWTHSPIHPDVYREIARSVRLKHAGTRTGEDGKRLVKERYGRKDTVGWFDEGASVETVVASLGEPTRTSADGKRVWEKVSEEDGYRSTERLELPFSDGTLTRFGEKYYDSGWETREAVEGSVPWMIEKSSPYEAPNEIGAEAKTMPEELGQELLALFLKHAVDPSQDFNGLCQVMGVLVQQGIDDRKSLDIVRKRFVSENSHFAAWVLHDAGHKEDVTLFIDKLRALYRKGEEAPDEDVTADLNMHNWFAFIPDKDARYPAILVEGLRSPNSSIRDCAYFFLEDSPLSRDERLAFVRAGLRDSSASVRSESAEFFSENEMSDADWELLKEISSREENKSTRGKMLKIIGARKTVQEGKTDE